MSRYPLQVRARRDAPLSRWLWLVKWLLLIPHYLVLGVLTAAFVVLTLVAYVAILVTGRYPHAIFSFNVGVLRWAWRVGYYGYNVLGTDRYPPFTLAEVPDYPAGLRVDYPPRPPRWLPLVAWLFAVPQLLIVGALTGVASYQFQPNSTTTISVPMGLVSVGVLVAGFALLFTRRYPRGLYNLLVGVARWSLRVVAYIAVLTPRYPPFRLDQGETEPDDGPDLPPDGAIALSHPSQAVQPAPAPAAGGVTGRVIALVAGVLLLFPAIGLGLGGAGVLVLNGARDANGFVTSPTLGVSSATAAVTVESVDLQVGDAWSRRVTDVGTVRLTATSPTGDPLFIGVAPESDVDSWLAGTAHDQLVELYGGGQPRYQRAAGEVGDLGAPAEQTFWVASAGGTSSVSLDWRPTSGRYAVVLSNADGTRGVTGDVRAATKVPGLAPLGIGLLTGGAAVLLAAFILIYVGASGLGRRHPVPPGPPAGPPVAPRPPTAVPQQSAATN
jgi:hypothetical protein